MSSDSFIPPEAPTIPLEESDGHDDIDSLGVVTGAPQVALGGVIADRYRLIAVLGQGGIGRVYQAVDLERQAEGKDPSIVAVKVLTRLSDDPAGQFAALRTQFDRCRRVRHPNIVRLLECERVGAVIFITMEYVTGESIYSKLHQKSSPGEAPPKPLARPEALQIIAAVAQALEFAHHRGLVHGDIKPGNVIVTERHEVKVIDFGMARWLSRPDGTESRLGEAQEAAATPIYASPQVLAGEEPTASDDVFSLACFAYEILTGAHPFGTDTSRAATPPRRRGLNTGEYEALLHGLQQERGNRISTIQQFTDEFAATPRRTLASLWPLWIGAAAIAVLGWLYFRPSPRTTAIAPPPQAAVTRPVQAPPLPGVAVERSGESNAPGTIIRDCPTCPSMTVLPTGQFQQGAADADSDASPLEKPRHVVRIGYPIAMSTTDITVENFRQFVVATGRSMEGCDTYDGEWRHRIAASWEAPGFAQSDRHPVTCVSWNDATAFAGWMSEKSGHRYRLPSASEWEYATRAGADAVRPWKSDRSGACANADVADRSAEQRFPGWAVFPCEDGYVFTAPAGSFKANEFGLSDMLGNVLVWTRDCWREDYAGAPSDGSAREDADCREHEVRGGSWFSPPPVVKASYRNHFAAEYRTSSVGFRLVRDMD